jgi:hypothetical protein
MKQIIRDQFTHIYIKKNQQYFYWYNISGQTYTLSFLLTEKIISIGEKNNSYKFGQREDYN